MVSTIGTIIIMIASCRDEVYPCFRVYSIKATPSLQDGCGVYDLPVVETTGYITLSRRDRKKVNLRIMKITELNIMENMMISKKEFIMKNKISGNCVCQRGWALLVGLSALASLMSVSPMCGAESKESVSRDMTADPPAVIRDFSGGASAEKVMTVDFFV